VVLTYRSPTTPRFVAAEKQLKGDSARHGNKTLFLFNSESCLSARVTLYNGKSADHLIHALPRGALAHLLPVRSSRSPKLHAVMHENREQYQKFSYNASFLLGAFANQPEFLQFLDLKLPKSVPDMGSRGKGTFVELANNVARCVKNEREHCLFLYLGFLPTYDFHFRFPNLRYPSVP
jgi:hypothetical protein